ncbi:MAG: DNA recombination protein RmuC [Propionibacteriaceae bacterium]|nr:DNA recombination protein RmuC [Propionibacteriaceae bacterium]
MNDIGWIVVALLGGIVLGWVACSLLQATRRGTAAERLRADSATAEARVARAAGEAADARAEAAAARAELARAETETERARYEVADARADTAEYQALLARAEAATTKAAGERDLAISEAEGLRRDRETLANSFRALADEALTRQTATVEQSAAQRLAATEQVLTPLRGSLEKLEARLTGIEKERAGLSAEMVTQVRHVQATGEILRRETSALVTALRKPTVRGAWGELQLKRVVELAGMVDHCDFVTQESAANETGGIRPDLKVNLAGGRFVYVDAKAPFEGYLDAQAAATDDERARGLATFARRVRTHVDLLAAKTYWKADPATPEFVVLFLPTEVWLMTALAETPDLVEYAATKNVMLATPTTLITLLRAVAYGWDQAQFTQSAREVWQLGRELYERLGKLGSHFDRLGRALETSVRSYNDAVGSLEGRVLVSARRFRDLRVTAEELAAVVPITTAGRPLTAEELVTNESFA